MSHKLRHVGDASTARPELPAMETGQAPCTPRSLRCRESTSRSCVPAIVRLRLRRAEPRRRARHPRSGGKPFTALKIDDLSDKAHLNIRLRTLAEGIESMSRRGGNAQRSLTESPKKRECAIGRPAASALAATSHVEKGRAAIEGFAGNAEVPEVSGREFERIPNVMSEGISAVDAQVAQRQVPGDVCFTGSGSHRTHSANS